MCNYRRLGLKSRLNPRVRGVTHLTTAPRWILEAFLRDRAGWLTRHSAASLSKCHQRNEFSQLLPVLLLPRSPGWCWVAGLSTQPGISLHRGVFQQGSGGICPSKDAALPGAVSAIKNPKLCMVGRQDRHRHSPWLRGHREGWQSVSLPRSRAGIWECALAEQKGPFGARLLIWGRVLPFLPVR